MRMEALVKRKEEARLKNKWDVFNALLLRIRQVG